MTKFFCLLCLLLSITVQAFAQQTLNLSLMHDGQERSYILYVPDSYSGIDPVPLVFNFHGFTSTASDQMGYGDLRAIADTAGFLVVHPQGALFSGLTHWNVGGWTAGSTTDDVGFTQAILDEIAAAYSIDAGRIYATGMSNGGFMSFLLACQLSDQFAAVASVTGLMTPETFAECNPAHPTPVLLIHSINDPVVPYNGISWAKSTADVINFWRSYNQCDSIPVVEAVPDISPFDGSTVEHIRYENGAGGVSVEHFKISGGGHTWPGTSGIGIGINRDIDASVEIWRFFSQYDITGRIGLATDLESGIAAQAPLRLYPNPASDRIFVDRNARGMSAYQIISAVGQVVARGELQPGTNTIELRKLPRGIYWLQVAGHKGKQILIRQRN